MTPIPSVAGPLSRRFDAAAARDGGTSFTFEATASERAKLAQECGLPGLDALAAAFTVTREGSDAVRVAGRVRAIVRQVCVVSLEEFASDMDELVDLRFRPEGEVEALAAARAARTSISDEGDEEDLPDPIVNGRIDLGAVAAEAFVLGLDPYPRRPGAAFAESAPPLAEPDASPFAALSAFRGRSGA